MQAVFRLRWTRTQARRTGETESRVGRGSGSSHGRGAEPAPPEKTHSGARVSRLPCRRLPPQRCPSLFQLAQFPKRLPGAEAASFSRCCRFSLGTLEVDCDPATRSFALTEQELPGAWRWPSSATRAASCLPGASPPRWRRRKSPPRRCTTADPGRAGLTARRLGDPPSPSLRRDKSAFAEPTARQVRLSPSLRRRPAWRDYGGQDGETRGRLREHRPSLNVTNR